MVAPSLPLVLTHQDEGHLLTSDKSLPASQTTARSFDNAHHVRVSDEDRRNRTGGISQEGYVNKPKCSQGTFSPGKHRTQQAEINGFNQCRNDTSTVEGTQTEMEGFVMEDSNFGIVHGSVSEVNNFLKGVHDNSEITDQLQISQDWLVNANMDADYIPTKKRVQWNDIHGKELVHVLEFEVSDVDSEDEDEDVDSHACTCSIQ